MTHDPSSATRIAAVAPPVTARSRMRETHADQGTLIMDPDQGNHALATAQTILASQGFAPPVAPISVRPAAPSLPDGGIVLEQTASSWSRPKPKADSSFVMLLMAAMAMIAALASIALMASRPDTEEAPVKVVAAAQPAPPLPPAPIVAPPVPAVATPDAIDVDDAPVAKPVPVAAKPVVVAPVQPSAAKPADKKAAKAAPGADQKKTLEQLLDELGEEQLKR